MARSAPIASAERRASSLRAGPIARAITSAPAAAPSRRRRASSTPYSSMVSSTSLRPSSATLPSWMLTLSSASRTWRTTVKIRIASLSSVQRSGRLRVPTSRSLRSGSKVPHGAKAREYFRHVTARLKTHALIQSRVLAPFLSPISLVCRRAQWRDLRLPLRACSVPPRP